MSENNLVLCYNRGCGQKYDPDKNAEDACQHHPGDPFFHDAYKGWTCCNKKCTDFTEFLNIKGCTLSPHSNIKPPEPEKQAPTDNPEEVIEVKPIVQSKLKRPPFDSPLVTVVPEIAPSLKQQVTTSHPDEKTQNPANTDSQIVEIGMMCKNGACNVAFEGPETNETVCTHHPGVPIFHEGLKYWSCCQKKTTEFSVFLAQVGCSQGKHLWIKEKGENTINCRWDHHQTGTHVIVSIYAKQYCPNKSTVQLNPIRLKACLVFPNENNGTFNMDLELRGIIDVKASQVSMYSTKVEIKMKKAEPGSWVKLDVPRTQNSDQKMSSAAKVDEITPQVDAVDLSDL